MRRLGAGLLLVAIAPLATAPAGAGDGGAGVPPVQTLAAAGAAVLFVLLVGLVLWNRALHRAVAEATAERDEREARLRRIIDNLMDGLIVIDETGVIESVNRAACAIFGYAADEMVGRNVAMLMASPDAERHDSYIARYLRTGEGRILGIGPREVTARRKDGTTFPLDLAASEITFGAERRFVGVVRDITRRKEARDALRAARDEAQLASRMKSEFLAMMSHELRTPLNAIIGFSEIIKTEGHGPLNNRRYLDYAADIHSSGRHLLDLIDDILDLAKIEDAARRLKEEDIDLARLVRAVLAAVAPRARRAGISLVFDPPPDLPRLRADPRRLNQIVTNLVTNAVKFSGPGGEVRIDVAADPDNGCLIRIADNGIGIAPEDIPKALAPFAQVDGSMGRKFAGTGIGLPLSVALVELHGGTLTLDSAPGVGTVVTVRFPPERVVP